MGGRGGWDVYVGVLRCCATLYTPEKRSDHTNGYGSKNIEGAVFHPKST